MEARFVAFSDIHIADFKKHSVDHSRLKLNTTIMRQIMDSAQRKNVPLLFCGDLFDNPNEVSNEELEVAVEIFNEMKRRSIKMYAIDGNHDQATKNSSTNRSVNWVTTFSKLYPNIISVSDNTIVHSGTYLIGIPYYKEKREFFEKLQELGKKYKNKQSVLMIHTSLPGLKEPNGMELIVDYLKAEDLIKEFRNYTLVLNGHIHKPQESFGNVITLGATHQQRQSDKGQDMGYWIINKDWSTRFIPLVTPKFREYTGSHPESPDYWIEIPKEAEDKTKQGIIFKPSHNSKVLAKNYLQAKGIKSKEKLNLITKYIDDARA